MVKTESMQNGNLQFKESLLPRGRRIILSIAGNQASSKRNSWSEKQKIFPPP
jgi:hypothetical protein